MNHIKVLKKKKKTERERGRGGRERRGRNRKRGEQTCLENKNIAHFSWFSTILKERKTESEPIPLVIRNAADLHTACPQPLRAPTAYLPCFTCTAHALQVVLTEQNKELRNETHKTCPRRGVLLHCGRDGPVSFRRVCFGTRRCNRSSFQTCSLARGFHRLSLRLCSDR